MSRALPRLCLIVAALAALVGPAAGACTRLGAVEIGCERDPRPPEPTAKRHPSANLLGLLNRERAARGLGSLARDPRADRLAGAHAREMARAGFSYPDPSLRSPSARAALGYPVRFREIVGAAGGPWSMHRAFMRTAVARAAILDRSARVIGIGARRSGGSLWVSEIIMVPGTRPAAAPADRRRTSAVAERPQRVPIAVARVPESTAAPRRGGGTAWPAAAAIATVALVAGAQAVKRRSANVRLPDRRTITVSDARSAGPRISSDEEIRRLPT